VIASAAFKRPTHPKQIPAIMIAKRNKIVIASALMAFLLPLICSAQQTNSLTLETLQAKFRTKQIEIETAFVLGHQDVPTKNPCPVPWVINQVSMTQ
jgi:hypothetical protein